MQLKKKNLIHDYVYIINKQQVNKMGDKIKTITTSYYNKGDDLEGLKFFREGKLTVN